MRNAMFLGLIAAAGAVLTGCGSDAPLPSTPVDSVPVEVRVARFDEIDGAIRQRKGNVVLVDFWATWCGPCRKSFPHLVERHKKYAPNGLACISVSLDDPLEKQKALEFLQKQDATFPNFLLIEGGQDEDRIVSRFGYNNSIPFLALFDKQGKKVWDRGQKDLGEKELDTLIETELKK